MLLLCSLCCLNFTFRSKESNERTCLCVRTGTVERTPVRFSTIRKSDPVASRFAHRWDRCPSKAVPFSTASLTPENPGRNIPSFQKSKRANTTADSKGTKGELEASILTAVEYLSTVARPFPPYHVGFRHSHIIVVLRERRRRRG